MRTGKLKATGNCFENAARYMVDQGIDNPQRELTLVHCVVVGTGGDAKGLGFAHAFIIEKQDLPAPPDGTFMIGDPFINLAIDIAKDYWNPVIVPLDYYRKLGNAKNEIHYTREEARKLMDESGTYGPWDDTLATDVDRSVSADSS